MLCVWLYVLLHGHYLLLPIHHIRTTLILSNSAVTNYSNSDCSIRVYFLIVILRVLLDWCCGKFQYSFWPLYLFKNIDVSSFRIRQILKWDQSTQCNVTMWVSMVMCYLWFGHPMAGDKSFSALMNLSSIKGWALKEAVLTICSTRVQLLLLVMYG